MSLCKSITEKVHLIYQALNVHFKEEEEKQSIKKEKLHWKIAAGC